MPTPPVPSPHPYILFPSTPLPSPLPLVLVVAVAANGAIGWRGGLPWRLPDDLRRFRALTMGKPVVMGRLTHESIGRPLDGRRSIVLSRDPEWQAPGARRAGSWAEAVALAGEAARELRAHEIAVIGGAAVFEAALPVARRIELTEVLAPVEGDVFFPPLDPARWRRREEGPVRHGPRDSHPYRFVTLEAADTVTP